MITVVIAPGAAETEACIVLIQARLPGYVVKCSVAVVAKHEIRRTILRVEIRHRIAVLIRSLVVGIKTEIDVQPAIPVIICDSGASESALRDVSKPKRVALQMEFCASLIKEQKRATRTNNDQILAAIIVNVGEQGASRVFQNPDSCSICNVFKSAIATIAKEPVGESGGLTNVNVIESVTVNVGN